jgi:hypothetical protein
LIITPSLASRIILAHDNTTAACNPEIPPSPSHHQLSATISSLSAFSPLALLSAAIALIHHCSRSHQLCPSCRPHSAYIAALGNPPAASLLVIDDAAFSAHVLPYIINTPVAESLPRARIDLRAQVERISGLLGLLSADVLWAFRCILFATCFPICFASFVADHKAAAVLCFPNLHNFCTLSL